MGWYDPWDVYDEPFFNDEYGLCSPHDAVSWQMSRFNSGEGATPNEYDTTVMLLTIASYKDDRKIMIDRTSYKDFF